MSVLISYLLKLVCKATSTRPALLYYPTISSFKWVSILDELSGESLPMTYIDISTSELYMCRNSHTAHCWTPESLSVL